jgi:hypothetical protein
LSQTGGRPAQETFTDEAQCRSWIGEYLGRWNIYFTVNRTKEGVNKKPKKIDIQAMRALHVDVDPRAGEDIEEERTAILSGLRAFMLASVQN